MSKAAQLRTALMVLLREHKRDGTIPTSGRFLSYELVNCRITRKQSNGKRRPDQDMAGGDIEGNTRRVLEHEAGELEWDRLALIEEQVRQYNQPKIIKRDRRFKSDQGVYEAVETEALSQHVIHEIVQSRLEALLPEPLKHVHEREEQKRQTLAEQIRR